MISPVARRYGKAIFNVAEEKKQLKDFSGVLIQLKEIFSDNEIFSFFSSPIISKEDKIKNLDKFEGLGEDLKKFLMILIDKNRIDSFNEIVDYFFKLKADKEKKITVTVTSAFPLSETSMNIIKEKLETTLNKELVINTKIDENLIGGVVIKYGDTVLDGSITRQLYDIKQKIKEGK